MPENAFKTAPLVVMNNFGKDEHMQLATVGCISLSQKLPANMIRITQLAMA
jgi:hypothetical protein